ncbi:FMN-linked oxidoreductase, partial [Thozetella sp. PMI_491]
MPSPRFSSGTVTDPAPLFQPLTFPSSGRTAPNRFLKAAMSEGASTWDPEDVSARGIPTPEVVNLYRHWGAGGWGLILTGNIMIDGAQLEARGSLVIPADAPFSGPRFDGFTALATATKVHGALAIGQVSHAGRQSIGQNSLSASGIQTVAPSLHRVFNKPRAATQADLAGLVASFVHASEFLEKAGFDGIELHAAHGYLLSEFLSRNTNKRTDEYGGSIENRMRLLLQIADAVRARVAKTFIIGAKINSIELNEDGITPDEAAAICEALDKNGFDYVELSGGNYEKTAWMHASEASRARENFFLPSADEIAKRVKNIKVYTTGGFKTVSGLVDALNVVHGVGMGKAACQEPRFPKELRVSPETMPGIIHRLGADNGDFSMVFSAGAQIRQISKDLEPVDLSVPENAEKVGMDIAGHFQKMSQDPKNLV